MAVSRIRRHYRTGALAALLVLLDFVIVTQVLGLSGRSFRWQTLADKEGTSVYTSRTVGRTRTRALPADHDGDGMDDPALFSSRRNEWLSRPSSSGTDISVPTPFGLPADTPLLPVIADFDGDGIDDPAAYDPDGSSGAPPGSWYFRKSTKGIDTAVFGYPGTVPVVGDFDGDNTDDFGCYDADGHLGEAPGTWYFMRSTAGGTGPLSLGYPGTVPVVGDFDGDGIDDYGVYDDVGRFGHPSGLWSFMLSTHGFMTAQFGYEGTVPFCGDFDGDGMSDYGVYDASGSAQHGVRPGSWFLMRSTDGFESKEFGYDGTVPVVGDFDGDGIDDYGFHDPLDATWTIHTSAVKGLSVFGFGWSEASLVVSGLPEEHDVSSPAGYGTNHADRWTILTNTVNSPADAEWWRRYVCEGWTGTGSISPAGSGTSTAFTLNTNSTLTWHWRKEYRVETGSTGHGSVTPASGWHTEGTSLTVHAHADPRYHFDEWDVLPRIGPGSSSTNNPLTLPVSDALTIGAAFDRNMGFLAIDLTPGGGSWTIALRPSDFGGQTNGTGDAPPVEVPTGDYKVRYGPLAGYATPITQLRALEWNQSVVFDGTYLVDSDGDGMDDAFETKHFGGPTNGIPERDSDGDGLSNEQERWAGTDPGDSNSVLELTGIDLQTKAGVRLQWPSVLGRVYGVDKSTNLLDGFFMLTNNLYADPPTNRYTDGGMPADTVFYRIFVEP